MVSARHRSQAKLYLMRWLGQVGRAIFIDGPLFTPEPRWAGLPPGHQVMGIVNVTPDSFSDGSGHTRYRSDRIG